MRWGGGFKWVAAGETCAPMEGVGPRRQSEILYYGRVERGNCNIQNLYRGSACGRQRPAVYIALPPGAARRRAVGGDARIATSPRGADHGMRGAGDVAGDTEINARTPHSHKPRACITHRWAPLGLRRV